LTWTEHFERILRFLASIEQLQITFGLKTALKAALAVVEVHAGLYYLFTNFFPKIAPKLAGL
jgi:hypothetical protein